MRRVRAIVYALVFTALAATPARTENVVRWANANGVPWWEPLAEDYSSLNGLLQVYEGLTHSDADLSLRPDLATSWVLVRSDTWRFELRQGVTFHDGAPFTAEDVAFSLGRARGETSEYASLLATIAAVTARGEHTVEITTKQPDLLLPVKLRHVAILSKAWAERHGAGLPARRDDTAAYTFAHEDGTGPFTLESFEPASKRAVLVRNAGWWGLKDYPHNIDRIVLTKEPDPERRLRLLLDGEVDFLQDPPLDRLDRLRGVPGIKLAKTSGLLTVLLGLDQGSPELRTSDVKGRNPFADRRVRQAVYQAIDVETLIAKKLRDAAVPAGMLVAPGINGYDPELDRRLPYDPQRARALLTDAGYPDGFAVRLDCLAYRQEACQELAAQLATVGLRMTVDIVPFDALVPRLRARASDSYLLGEDSAITLDSIEPLREVFGYPPVWFGGATGYANPTLQMLFDKIDGELSSPIRDALIEQAWRIVLGDIVVIPLYRPLVVWVMRDALELPVSPFNGPRFYQARLTSPR